MFEYFDHTADVGIRVRAADLPTLFAEAGAALFGLIVADLGAVRPLQSESFDIEGHELDYLLFDWLSELLYRFETQRLVLCRFDVNVTDEGLSAQVAGELFDLRRHRPHHEVKAITYHELQVTQTPGGWEAEVIVDI